jgi:microcystin-dependent protein
MAQPYVGEIRLFAGNFAPAGWMFCDGSVIPISEYDTLFNLIGTTYGGDGQQTFAVPDFRGRLPVHMGQNFPIGSSGGTETVTLTVNEFPQHTHAMLATTGTSNSPNPAGNLIGQSTQAQVFFGDPPSGHMNPAVVSQTGGSQAHENMMPYLCIAFIISLYGIYPSPT